MKQFYSSFVFLLLMSMGASAQVVISQVYGGGGNSGATLKNDFIELHNIGTTTVNVSGWSVQYASSTGTSWQRTNLSGSISPGQYYLVQQAQGSGGTVNLPTPDAIGTIPMAAGSGKVALVNNQTTLTGSCPTGAHIMDFVGFGSANCSETAPTPVLTNTTAAIRKTNGCTETNNNSSDFEVGTPAPRNSSVVYTCASVPLQVSVLAGNDASEPGISGSLEFTLSVPAPSGGVSITYNLSGTATISTDYTDANSGALVIPSGSSSASIDLTALDDDLTEGTETITIHLLTANNGYSIDAGTASINLFDNEGQLNYTYTLDNCISSLPEGFGEYSVTGPQKWTCTSFGRPSTRGVNINGFSGGANFNEDWLISPSFDLSGTAYPLLSFYSRAEFSGPSLQLKVSTDYPGYGDPNNATWTDLDGRFPEVGTNAWTLSENISLSAYKQSSVYIAWVYTSNDEEAARWTLDDIRLDNSLTPPPPTLTVNGELLNFNYTAYGSAATKSFTFIGTDLTGPVALSVTGPFTISKDGINFSSSIQYSLTEANNVLKTVYVRFAPTGVNSNYSGTITINTASLTETVNLKGSSMDPATTLDVVNWNIEWFGSASLGPSNDNLQEQNVVNVMNSLDADLYALGEIVSEPRLQSVVSQLPGYAYVIGNYGSGATTPTGIASAQKLAFVYNTSVFSNVSVRPMINAASGTTSYTNWSSGRYPFLMTADVMVNCVTKTVSFILIHAKANTSPLITSYNRRKAAAEELKDTIDTHFNNDHVIILGDF
ncbi:MAG TPA: choice-of-anchor J domain-containing protein, partial [Chitinophagaceae bacterium]